MKSLPAQLQGLRRNCRLSQRELGKRVGMPQSHVSAIEGEKVDPRLSSIVEMARVLGYEVIVVPRMLLPAVQALLGGEPDAPLWQTDEP